MPTIIRFVMTLAVIAVLVGAAMFYLANFVEPGDREMTARIPADRIDPVPIMLPAQPPAAKAPAPETAPPAE
jgi:hypothetical protein